MSTLRPTPPVRRERHPTVERFRALFDRDPSDEELAAFRAAHEALVLGIPARVRRTAARVIARG